MLLTNCGKLITISKCVMEERKIFSHSIKIFCTTLINSHFSLTLHNPPQSCGFIKDCVPNESIPQNNKIEDGCMEYSLYLFIENLHLVYNL